MFDVTLYKEHATMPIENTKGCESMNQEPYNNPYLYKYL